MTQTIIARVQVKSAWISKINWLQVGGALLTLATTLVAQDALGLDPATTVKVLACLNVAQGGLTWIAKTWFTSTVTPSSLAK